ncbi:MAG: SPBc2 prophage-derived aminoglycoside N(3')-acetyltransferase-like protein YokD [Syntrophomonadaceae bacterium]|nr:SPBc2 prophage-derived aminoglycoside N(3')-acetyltransferase-like protein YokD [Bacillota bacterium]
MLKREEDGNMNKAEIIVGLKGIGLKKGDIVLLHSALSSLGYVEGGADTVIDAFLDVLGKEGTLIVPAFGNLGIIAVRVKKRPESVVSIHPAAAVAAIGGKAEIICKDHWKAGTAHGKNTPYTRMAEMGGYVVLLGVDQDRSTTLHTPEVLAKLPYLKTIKRKFETPEGEKEKSWDFFPGPHRDFIGMDKLLKGSGKLKVFKIGNSVVRIIKGQDLIDIAGGLLKKNKDAVLCDNPHCQDCISQRADINRGLFSQEDFTLLTSSSLAGRYVPEIIENMKNTGVDGIELDFIQGKEVSDISLEKLKQYGDEFKEAEIPVFSLRTRRVQKEIEGLIKKARENNILKVVMPLVPNLEDYLNFAKEKNVSLVFENSDISGDVTSDILMKYKDIKLEFAFNPANFAFSGEKPFLQSFQKPLRKFITHLYVNDGTFDNIYTPLGQGNAEIKELVSILRCKSFSGGLVLDASLRYSGNLKKAVSDFANRILGGI